MMDLLTREAEAPARVAPPRFRMLVPLGAFAAGCAVIAVGALQQGAGRDALVGALILAGILAGITCAVFGLVVRRALMAPQAQSRLAVLLGILSVATVAAFWSGLPMVLGAAAAVVGTDVRTRGVLRTRRLGSGTAAIALGILAMVGGAASSVSDAVRTPAGGPVIQVSANEYGYAMPSEVTGGVVSFELANRGEEWHEFAFARLEEGRTVDDVLEAVAAGEHPDWAQDLAGVPVLSPGRQVTMTRELEEPGTYVFLCALPSPDLQPHAQLGMVTSFEVAGSSGAALPEPDVVITATDDGLVVPEITAGRQVIELRSEGTRPHELWLATFTDGATDADVEEWIIGGQEGPAPAVFVGGIQTIAPGTPVFQELELERGVSYTVADYADGAETTFTPR